MKYKVIGHKKGNTYTVLGEVRTTINSDAVYQIYDYIYSLKWNGSVKDFNKAMNVQIKEVI